jgi:hypothetical protein
MRIDRNKLQAKYALEVYKMVDGFPSTIDILYEVVSVLQDRNKLDQHFVSKELLKEVPSRIEGEDLEHTLSRLAEDGWLERIDNSYVLIDHPWRTM